MIEICIQISETEDFQDENQPITLQMMGHILGAKDSPCCACFALRKTAIDNAESLKALPFNLSNAIFTWMI